MMIHHHGHAQVWRYLPFVEILVNCFAQYRNFLFVTMFPGYRRVTTFRGDAAPDLGTFTTSPTLSTPRSAATISCCTCHCLREISLAHSLASPPLNGYCREF